MRLSNQRYAWIDTLFALPEAVLYACLVDYFDRHETAREARLREAVGGHPRVHRPAHRDESLKAIVSAQLLDYIERDEELAETLHKFRSSGKKLFLLTNSAWDYTTR